MVTSDTRATAWQAPLFLDGAWVDGHESSPVYDKFTGREIGQVARATREQVDRAVHGARRSFERERLDGQRRYQILHDTASLVEERRKDFVERIVAEAGFPIADADNEVSRTIQTLLLSAEEGKRLTGEMVPIENAPGNAHRLAFTIRVPRGVVCGITSFNSPLNMVAHKLAPALAAGNTVIIKPPQATPFSAVLLFELLLQAGLPPRHVALVQGHGAEVGRWLVENPDIRFFSFTGSTTVGRLLQRSVGLRPITLELGSISATVVCDDADLERAAPRCVAAGFRRAGQVCTSLQRLFVQDTAVDRFTPLLIEAAGRMKVGDPRDADTMVGPMISETEARRAEEWIAEAVARGARVVHGGRRNGALFEPTILVGADRDMKVMCEEVFAPVLSIIPFRTLEGAVDEVNSVPFGLAAGVFTRDINRAMFAARALHVGIVHINEPSSSRVDLIPFAGVKDSGLGREGPKYAMQEMTEERLITLSLENPR